MDQDEKREYNRLYAIANKDRIAARRKARRAGLGDEVRRCSVLGCDGVSDARGYCGRHYMAWKRNGDPTEVRQVQHHGKTIAERMALYTRRGSGCWEWTGATLAKGYGSVNRTGGSRVAHRVAWELEHGPVPRGLYVLHRCDNPGCVRVSHLFLGTKADNNADMDAKGRRRTKTIRGTAHPKSKLTDAAVREIRRSPAMGTELARKFGVSESIISAVRKRKTWNHVQ